MFIYFFSLVAFLGAFLLFIIQPIAGRLTLPVFGGSSMVWTFVMLFFTAILLFGYAYVVWITKLSKRKQFLVHALAILICLIWLAVTFLGKHDLFSGVSFQDIQRTPSISLLFFLFKALAIPSFLLATTSSLVQSWYAGLNERKSPYWLYIISNLGSFAGLLAYPFLVEPHLSLKTQQEAWIFGILLYSLSMLAITFLVYKKTLRIEINPAVFKMTLNRGLAWFVLPFISTTAMLAITTHLTYEVSPIPYIWVATLGVYLLSFAVAFIERNWYPKIFFEILLLCLVAAAGSSIFKSFEANYRFIFEFSLLLLFIIDLVCHRELFARRPRPEGLSYFYLMIGAGGVGASVFSAIIAPNIFPDLWEYPFAIIASVFVAVFVLLKSKQAILRFFSILLGVATVGIYIWFYVQTQSRLYGGYEVSTLVKLRNFYGVSRVLKRGNEEPYVLQLVNGQIIHGDQTMAISTEYEPSTYYTRDSGLGLAILGSPNRLKKLPMKIGVIGLGAGTAAAYCGKGDAIRFYEINPQVITVAQEYFTYLSNAEKVGCTVNLVPGDARISLERELKEGKNNEYDVLAVDAFTDDSIPTHLLTSEAIDLYLSHIKPQGAIAIHISNKFLDFTKVLKPMAEAKGLYYQEVNTPKALWALLSMYPLGKDSLIPTGPFPLKHWTDEYSNIFQIFRK